MKPWREVAIPHPDVLGGSFLQSEFAADLNAVHSGKATNEYQDAKAFYQRTFITEGMRNLLISVATRLSGKGGDPVLQLQTSFGGGKTHTMLAVYHLATRKCRLTELPGMQKLLESAGMSDVPLARVAVIDGNSLSPGQARIRGIRKVNTLWGELAWQLGGEALYSLIADSDEQGTSPGKELLQKLLEQASPAVILVDELVAYIRQFDLGKALPGGTYDSNLSFLQALTEVVKLVPSAVLLASLPESEVEAGSAHGLGVLKALEKTFGRVQALWKPVATEEAFEIVRRRLFTDIQDTRTRDEVCSAFAETYLAENGKFPSETQEARYRERLIQSYPVHPEVFSRLYEDWSTLQGFQRTRGVLKLMAKTIHRLWQDQNQDYLIMPGSFPLYDGSCRGELTQHLAQGWDPVIERDIDGERAETTILESRESRFGTVLAARRVARTIFMGTAPGAGVLQGGIKGLDTAHILLGSVQAGQQCSVYTDALKRLADHLHYLNSSGEVQDSARFWFDTRANLRREMEDRKARFDEKKEVRDRIAKELRSITNGSNFFEGVHVFSSHADTPDDTVLRLVILPPSCHFNLQDTTLAYETVRDYTKSNGTKPRHHVNRLLFLAPDFLSWSRLADQTKTALAWESIVDDIAAMRLNCDRQQESQAKKSALSAVSVIPTTLRECYKWLLCPSQTDPADRSIDIEHYSIPTSGSSYMQALDQVCRDNELVIDRWAAIHLCSILNNYYWKGGSPEVSGKLLWEDFSKYLYLPRLKNMDSLYTVLLSGSSSKDFFGLALGKDGATYTGFSFGKSLFTVDAEILIIKPEEAARVEHQIQEEQQRKEEQHGINSAGTAVTPECSDKPNIYTTSSTCTSVPPGGIDNESQAAITSFHGSVSISPSSFKIKLQDIADEILQHLASNPNIALDIRLEVSAQFPGGASASIQRTVSENSRNLGFNVIEWE